MTRLIPLFAAIWIGSAAACSAPVRPETLLPLPAEQVALQTAEGQALLRGAEAAADYGPLSIHFLTQDTPTYCGPASVAMVLNASGIARPPRSNGEPYSLFDQQNVFNAQARKVKAPALVRKDGLTLEQLAGFFEAHNAAVTLTRADTLTVEAFRDTAIRTLSTEGEFMVVNYLRSAMGQETGGHISPLAAYDADTDMFLILDVARYKYPPMWVGAAELHSAMNTPAGPHTRGFVVVRVPAS